MVGIIRSMAQRCGSRTLSMLDYFLCLPTSAQICSQDTKALPALQYPEARKVSASDPKKINLESVLARHALSF